MLLFAVLASPPRCTVYTVYTSTSYCTKVLNVGQRQMKGRTTNAYVAACFKRVEGLQLDHPLSMTTSSHVTTRHVLCPLAEYCDKGIEFGAGVDQSQLLAIRCAVDSRVESKVLCNLC